MQEKREGKKIIVNWEKGEKSKLDVIEQNLNWDERKNEKRERDERKWETWMREHISEIVLWECIKWDRGECRENVTRKKWERKLD